MSYAVIGCAVLSLFLFCYMFNFKTDQKVFRLTVIFLCKASLRTKMSQSQSQQSQSQQKQVLKVPVQLDFHSLTSLKPF